MKTCVRKEMNTTPKSESTKQKVSEMLIRLLSYNAISLNDFLHFFLDDLINLTCSNKGFFCKLSEKTKSFELIDIISRTESPRPHKQLLKDYKLSEAGPWVQAFEQNKIILQNSQSNLFPLPENKGLFEIAGRFCSISFTTNNLANHVLVITDKETDYDSGDYETLELLMGPVSKIAENLRRLEELTVAKEKAERNEQLKLSYLTNISHEIKTPVNAIAGFAQLLKENDLSSENRQKFLDVILESSTDLVEIINNVSEISSVESGLIKINEKEVLLSDLFNELSDHFKEEALAKKLIFKTEIPISENEGFVLTDRARLLQVLTALLSNSFKFTFTGKIIFGYKYKGDLIEFFVSDTGIGIPKEEKDKIFNHFFQAANSTSKSFKGTGLGLTITKAVIEQMGGEIWCNSSEGKGSDFHFIVPCKRSEIPYMLDSASVHGSGVQHKRRKIILVAEDDNLNFSLIQRFLSSLDVEILRAVNGKEAVDICSLKKVDLVLMDIKMPVMDGFAATRIIREADPDQIIIAQTAYINDRDTCLENGFNDFIAKPFGKIPLINLLNSYI
jgi:signal transduction histidine kinase/CheY-like chemotaxis protein